MCFVINNPVAYAAGLLLLCRKHLYMNMLPKMIHCANMDTYVCDEIVRMRREERLERIT